MINNGFIHVKKSFGPITEACGSLQKHELNSNFIKRLAVYDQSGRIKTIEGQCQLVQCHYGDGVHG